MALNPLQDFPKIPTAPFDQGCRASQAIISWPSSILVWSIRVQVSGLHFVLCRGYRHMLQRNQGGEVLVNVAFCKDGGVVVFTIWVILENRRKLLSRFGTNRNKEIGRKKNTVLHRYPDVLRSYAIQTMFC